MPRDKKTELMFALKKMRDDLEWLQARLDLDILTPEQVGSRLRNKSIEIGAIACMPFRDPPEKR